MIVKSSSHLCLPKDIGSAVQVSRTQIVVWQSTKLCGRAYFGQTMSRNKESTMSNIGFQLQPGKQIVLKAAPGLIRDLANSIAAAEPIRWARA